MSFILSIETAVKGCSVAVHHGGELIADVNLHNERVASSLLTTAIQHAVTLSDLQLADLSAIAISEGPGSYTGLRIGLSTAKGLCFALDKPLIAVNTLQIMTEAVGCFHDTTDYLCPLLDARRMEVYSTLIDAKSKEVVEEIAAKVVDATTYTSLLTEKRVCFFGDGAEKLRPLYAANKHALFLPHTVHPSAAAMGKLAYRAFGEENFVSVAAFEPFYLKPYFATTPKNKLRP